MQDIFSKFQINLLKHLLSGINTVKGQGKLFTFTNPNPGVKFDFDTKEVSFKQLTTAEFQD